MPPPHPLSHHHLSLSLLRFFFCSFFLGFPFSYCSRLAAPSPLTTRYRGRGVLKRRESHCPAPGSRSVPRNARHPSPCSPRDRGPGGRPAGRLAHRTVRAHSCAGGAPASPSASCTRRGPLSWVWNARYERARNLRKNRSLAGKSARRTTLSGPTSPRSHYFISGNKSIALLRSQS